jgi:hypothetical protein
MNLMQRAYYNGHYKHHGVKVQHVLQADGMAHSFTCQICYQDALAFKKSSMILILSALYVNGDWNRPAIIITDKTYGKTNHCKPPHTAAELGWWHLMKELLQWSSTKNIRTPMAVNIHLTTREQVLPNWW